MELHKTYDCRKHLLWKYGNIIWQQHSRPSKSSQSDYKHEFYTKIGLASAQHHPGHVFDSSWLAFRRQFATLSASTLRCIWRGGVSEYYSHTNTHCTYRA